MILLKIFIFSLLSFNFCDCSKLLLVFSLPGKSHFILAKALVNGLLEKGHDITLITPFSINDPSKNGKYTEILLSDFEHKRNTNKFNLFEFKDMNPIKYQLFMNFMGNELTEQTLNHTNVKKLLNSKEKFDAVIIEQFVNDAFKAIAYHFNAPLILFSSFGSSAWINPLIGNPAPPSYVAEQTITYTSFDFLFRLKNLFIYILGEINRNFIFFPQQNKILKKHFPYAPDLNVLNYNVSLVLLNSHISTNQPVPRVPNMIDIGGFHVESPKNLSHDLKNFLDYSKEGVIYFSMGSNLRCVDLPEEKLKALLGAFSKLNMKVLWKWEEDKLVGQPPNVKLGKWLPQQDILAHPNVKIFITHGGLLSLTETIYHDVPVLVIPIFGDQQINAANVLFNGYGLNLEYNEITEEKLLEKLNELINNSKYRENAKRRSKIFHDRPLKPLDLADFWIRHIIRHKGGLHMRVAALDLYWYEYISIDIFVVIFVFIIYIIYLMRFVIYLYCQTKKQKQIKIKKH